MLRCRSESRAQPRKQWPSQGTNSFKRPTPEKMAETRALQIFFRPIPYSINFPPPTSFAQAPEPLPVRAVCPFLIFFALITLQLETFDPRK
jgi:hypothetical protein